MKIGIIGHVSHLHNTLYYDCFSLSRQIKSMARYENGYTGCELIQMQNLALSLGNSIEFVKQEMDRIKFNSDEKLILNEIEFKKLSYGNLSSINSLPSRAEIQEQKFRKTQQKLRQKFYRK